VPALAISVMLVDDHPVMRVGLANVLSINHGFRIVAQADDGPSAIDLWRKHRPDVCLLDVSMERMDGIETLRRLRAEFPQARVLMLTSSKAGEDMALAMQSGAAGYLLKTVRHEELAAAIRAVCHGEVVTTPLAMPPERPPKDVLSRRELEVLGLIRQGFSNDEIGKLLGISTRPDAQFFLSQTDGNLVLNYSIIVVPEPGGIALAAVGLAAVAAWRARRGRESGCLGPQL
jgi:DNA-binding NarL/FixJ family response regulator